LCRSFARLWIPFFLAGGALEGANGDILRVSRALEGKKVIDIAIDGSDGSFWALGANGGSVDLHRVFHLRADLESVIESFPNPHPAGSIAANDLTVNRGLAYRPLSRTLFVLSSVGPRESQDYVLREMRRDGTEVEGSVATVAVAGKDVNLYGIVYDTLRQEFWTLDTHNDQLVRFSLAGVVTQSFLVPGKTAPEVEIRGRGVFADVEIIDQRPVSRLYVPEGDIFQEGPVKVIQVGAEPADDGGRLMAPRTGVELPLSAIPDSGGLGGFVFYRAGPQRRMAIVGGDGLIYQLEHVVSNPLPPSEVVCSLTVANQVRVAWRNRGTASGNAYRAGVQVLRNGIPLANLPGDAESFLDTTPVEGTATYAARGSDVFGAFGAASCPCQVTVGPGGLVAWRHTSAAALGDICRDPRDGAIYATDSGQGAILIFEDDLSPRRSMPGPWSDPAGIAFVPSIQLGFPPSTFNNLLAVTRLGGNQLRLIDVDGAVKTTTNLNFVGLANGSAATIGGLAYIPDLQRFVAVETGTRMIFQFSASGAYLSSCVPPSFLLDEPIDLALAFDPLQGTFMTAFQDGIVRELFAGGSCPPSGFEVSLASLGKDAVAPGFASGLEISGNTLLVSNRATGALFKALLFPFTPRFTRGDVDKSGGVDITDVVQLTRYLFQGGQAPVCLDAADANDDGLVELSDPVYLLFWLFIPQSPPPPEPFPESGEDPSFRDNLGCAS
jgi:hypothetical protein